MQLNPNSADWQAELGNQYLMAGDVKRALKSFRNALEHEHGSSSALTGIVHCQLLEGDLSDAQTQLEFMREVQQEIKNSSVKKRRKSLIFLYKIVQIFKVLKFLEAKLAKAKQQPKQDVVKAFSAAVDAAFAELQVQHF